MVDNRFITTANDFELLRGLGSHERLADELDNAKVVDSRRAPPEFATMNSRSRFEDQAAGETREVTILFPQDADALAREARRSYDDAIIDTHGDVDSEVA